VSVGRLKAVMVFSFVASRVDKWATLALIPGPSRDIAKHTFVIGATQYKSRTKKEHEKLLVILQTPRVGSTPSAITYVVTERGPDPDDMSAKRRQNSSMLPSPMGSSSNLPLSLTDVRANDLIFVPGTRRYQPLDSYKKQLKEKHDILCTVTLTTPMSLAQLAVLLKAVNQHSVDYDLWTYQCYWYAYTIWEVLRTQYGGTVTENKLQDRRGKYMGVKIRREDSVEAINEKYGKAWQTFCDEETRARQRAEEAARQLAQEAIQQAEVRGEARGVAQERARNQDVLRELDAYRKAIGPLPK